MPSFEYKSLPSLHGCNSISSLAVYLRDKKGPHVIIAPESQFDSLEQTFLFFHPEQRIFKFPALDPWFPSRTTMIERTNWLYHALNSSSDDIFLCSYKSLQQKTLPQSRFQKYFLSLSPGSMCPSPQTLEKYGYIESFPLEEAGFYSRKGGILDIFSPQAPFRIQTLGDQIESIYFFDPQTQANLSTCKSFVLIPLFESLLFSNQKLSTFKRLEKYSFIPKDFLKKLSRDIFFSERALLLPLIYEKCEEALSFFKTSPYVWCMESEFENSNEFAPSNPQESSFIHQMISSFYFKEISLPQKTTLLKPLIEESSTDIYPVQTFKTKVFPSEDFFKNHFSILSTSSESQLNYINFKLKKMNLEPFVVQKPERDWEDWKFEQIQNPQKVHIILGELLENFKTNDSIFLNADLFFKHIKNQTPTLKTPLKLKALHFSEVQKGDLVVDKIHGVGRYQGLKKLDYKNSFGEYIELEYKDKNRLYIPISKINRLYKFKTNLPSLSSDKLLDILGNLNWKQKNS